MTKEICYGVLRQIKLLSENYTIWQCDGSATVLQCTHGWLSIFGFWIDGQAKQKII